MPHIKEASTRVQRSCAQAKDTIALAVKNGMTAVKFMRARKGAGSNRIEVTQAVFPDKLSNARRSMRGT